MLSAAAPGCQWKMGVKQEGNEGNTVMALGFCASGETRRVMLEAQSERSLKHLSFIEEVSLVPLKAPQNLSLRMNMGKTDDAFS